MSMEMASQEKRPRMASSGAGRPSGKLLASSSPDQLARPWSSTSLLQSLAPGPPDQLAVSGSSSGHIWPSLHVREGPHRSLQTDWSTHGSQVATQTFQQCAKKKMWFDRTNVQLSLSPRSSTGTKRPITDCIGNVCGHTGCVKSQFLLVWCIRARLPRM